jgi:hypothetical protein
LGGIILDFDGRYFRFLELCFFDGWEQVILERIFGALS